MSITERRETLAKLRRIKDAVLFFSPTSKRTLSQLGMISILRFWAMRQRGGLKKYLNRLADTLEEDMGGSNANRS